MIGNLPMFSKAIMPVVLVVAGCSGDGSISSTAPKPDSQNVDAKQTNGQPAQISLATKQSLTKTQSISSVSIPKLLEVRGDDPASIYMAKALIEKSSEAQEAIKSAKSGIADEGISNSDLELISSELGKIKEFVPAAHGGTAVRYDRFVIASIGGHIRENYVNVYLIRVAGHGWIYLEKREVPAPMSTGRH